MDSKQLKQKQVELAKEIRQLADKFNDPKYQHDSEDQAKWEAVNGEYNTLGEQIERAKRAEQVERDLQELDEAEDRSKTPGRQNYDGREQAKQPATLEDRAKALQAWGRYGLGLDLRDDQAEAMRRVGINPNAREVNVPLIASAADVRKLGQMYLREMRDTAYTSKAASAGGDTVPPGDLVSQLEVALLAFGGVRRAADVLRTNSGEPLVWPTANDTSNKGARIGETINSGVAAVPDQNVTTGNVTFGAYTYTSRLIRVTNELLEDEAVNLVSFLANTLGERIGRIQNEEFTTGTGTGQPEGIVTGSAVGKTAALTNAITADEIIDLIHSVDPAYRGNARFMMHDSIVSVIRKLKDSQGQYLWQSGLRDGLPDTLLGFPMIVNQDMASTLAAGNKIMLFGDLSKYKVRDVGNIRIVRANERYVEFNQVGWVAFARADARMVDAGTNPVKLLQMAAS